MKGLYKILIILSLCVLLFFVCMVASFFGCGACIILFEAYLKNIPDSAIFCLFALLFIGGLIVVIRKNIAELAQDGLPSRGQSVLLWSVPAILLWMFSTYLGWKMDNGWLFLFGFIIVLLGVVGGCVFPFKCGTNVFWKTVRTLGVAFAFFLYLIFGGLLGCNGKDISYEGNNVADIPKAGRWIANAWIPAGASEIKIEGTTIHCEWSCRVSEEDFLKFKSEAKYGSEFKIIEEPLNFTDKGPFPYYFYEYRQNNGGGISISYHIESQRLTGSYSHH